MSPTLTCLALALVGVDLGYRPATNGGVDFIIHINPTTLQALRTGESIDLDVSREAREMRANHFSITPGNAKLSGEVSVASLLPPATAPIVTASPVMPAGAAATFSPGAPPAGNPLGMPPPSTSAPPRSTAAHGWPLLTPTHPALSPATAGSRDSRIAGLAPVNTEGGNSVQPDRPWLGMCLLVIALLASNVYVGWLFWDARQRYRGLLTRTFSLGQQAAEA